MTSDAALIARARWWADELQEPELREVLLHIVQAFAEKDTEIEQLRCEVGLLREVGRRPLIHAKAR